MEVISRQMKQKQGISSHQYSTVLFEGKESEVSFMLSGLCVTIVLEEKKSLAP